MAFAYARVVGEDTRPQDGEPSAEEIELFHQDLTENDLQEVLNLLSRHFAQKARVEAQRYVLENNISQKELKETTDSINDNRTEYFRKIRKAKV